MKLDEIQQKLQAEDIDGWLFFDHHVRDPIAYRVLGIEPGHVTRRWYYWLPARGEPRKLTHRIEPRVLQSLPGQQQVYSSWQEQQERLSEILKGVRRAAMQYSPKCMIPYVSLVDAGTVELVRELGVEVVGSATLVQYFEARWTQEQLEMHQEAGRRVDQIRREAFDYIASRIKADTVVQEYEIAEFIRRRFAESEMTTDEGPVVAVGPNSSDPHYAPTRDRSSPIRQGNFVLIDLWAKLKQPRSVYYDVTWTGYCGQEPPQEIQRVFEIVTTARDRAVQLVQAAIGEKKPITGAEVDDEVRGCIRDRGHGDDFVHRTGHSIGEEVHGNGANIDNLETHDRRPIIAGTCFSIEPGIYLKEFGLRSEINCYVSDTGAGPTGEVQNEIVRIG